MFRLTSILLWLALSAATVFGQVTPLPTLPPMTPLPTVPAGSVTSCGPIIDIAAMGFGRGYLLRSCESNGVASTAIVGGGFKPAFVNDMKRASDGSIIVLAGSGLVIRNRNFTTQWFPVGLSTGMLTASYDQVVTLREFDYAMDYTFSSDGSLFGRPIYPVRQFGRCNQVLLTLENDTYCVDRSTGTMEVIVDGGRSRQPKTYFQKRGLVFVREYRGGFLALVIPEFDCSSGSCRVVKPSELLWLTGREKPFVRTVYLGLNVNFQSTFVVSGDTIFVVESNVDNTGSWIGDQIVKLDFLTGQKNLYIGPEFLQRELDSRQYVLTIN